jgi:L-ascorbate metabolism protein UlaG (beta-lactamase superfamily)
MFEIEYKGANSVIITTKKARLVVDPKLSIVGLKDVSTKESVELATEARFAINSPESILTIDGPGEYGVADLDIKGIPARCFIDDESKGLFSTIYRIEIGESRIGVIGNICEKMTDEQLEDLGVIDVLILPVGGGGYTLDANGASAMVRMINPKVVIPIHYNDRQLKYEVPQDKLDLFVAELGAPVETVQKYKVKQQLLAGTPLSIVEIIRS